MKRLIVQHYTFMLASKNSAGAGLPLGFSDSTASRERVILEVTVVVNPHRPPPKPDGTGTDNKEGWRAGGMI